jgi:hypothetical protein
MVDVLMLSEVTVYCSEDKNHSSYSSTEIKDDKDVICRSCYEDIKNKLYSATIELSYLKKDIKHYEGLLDELYAFKDKVINSPDCPKEILAIVVAERL